MTIAEIDVSFTEKGTTADPFPILHKIQDLGPVVRNTLTGDYLVTRYADIRTVFAESERFVQNEQMWMEMLGGHNLSSLNGSLHTAMRARWRNEFDRRTVTQRWEQLIRDVTDEYMDPVIERLRSGETVDFVHSAIFPIPMVVILRVMGIDAEFSGNFRQWAEDILGIFNALVETDENRSRELYERGRAAKQEADEFAATILAERRAAPVDQDLVSLLIQEPIRSVDSPTPSEMSEADLRSQLAQVVFAAQDNSANTMASSLVTLAQHPDQRRALAANPSLIPQAVDELLRFHSPVMAVTRDLRGGDYVLHDSLIPDGSSVWPLIGAGNRDPRKWDNPDAFDIFREKVAHLAFGFGRHYCIGITFGRLELQLFLAKMLKEIPEWELDSDEIDYGDSFLTRGPKAVPLRCA